VWLKGMKNEVLPMTVYQWKMSSKGRKKQKSLPGQSFPPNRFLGKRRDEQGMINPELISLKQLLHL
jgi:hypothetical protein